MEEEQCGSSSVGLCSDFRENRVQTQGFTETEAAWKQSSTGFLPFAAAIECPD